ncbi:MAG: adenylosuccinate synthetase [Candidatus Saganbacteria bacterium]|nr:adenylosuccinate synthetase [Candidatus Saganbacteria bacterium]
MFRPIRPLMPHTVTAVLDPILGDGGKGATVLFLALLLHAAKVVRIGGPNAGHGAVSPFGNRHVFNQVPAGAFSRYAYLMLEKGMAVDPLRLLNELEDLRRIGHSDVLSRLLLSPDSPMVMAYHVILNRVGEIAKFNHGSTGRGCWEATLDEAEGGMLVKDLLLSPADFQRKLEGILVGKRAKLQWFLENARAGSQGKIAKYYQPSRDDCLFDAAYLTELYQRAADVIGHRILTESDPNPIMAAIMSGENVIVEWSQSVCLDKDLGTVPNNCPYDTTLKALASGTNIPIEALKQVVLACRAYGTRHGPGMFPTEMARNQEGASTLKDYGADRIDNSWDLGFRVGWLDLAMLKFAVENTYAILSAAHQEKDVPILLSISCLDRLDGFKEVKVCTHYEYTEPSHFDALKDAGVSVTKKGDTLIIDQFHPALSSNEMFRGNIEPVYKVMKGWNVGREGLHEMALARTREDLDPHMQDFLSLIEETVGRKNDKLTAQVGIVGLGPENQKRFMV